jgi:hypothetical protein
MHKGTVLAAVEEMLTNPEAHTIGSKTAKPSYQRVRALRKAEADAEAIPGT